MRCLITGSTGLVGSEAVKFFSEKGWEVVGVDNNMRSKFFGTPGKAATTMLDIRDTYNIFRLFEKEKFDAVIHAAAQPSHDYSKEHVIEDFEVNALGTLNLLEACRKYSPQAVFVHVSTDKIYGHGMRRGNLLEKDTRWHNDVPFDERTPVESPLTPFGVSKLCADFYAQEYVSQGWLTTGIFRPGCITGKNHEGAEQHGFLAYLTKCIKEEKPYKIYGYKGKQVRDQIHAHDLVSAFWHFIRKPVSGAFYNIGGGEERSVSVIEASKLIGEKLGKEPILEYVEEERFADRQWDIHDCSKFRKDYPEWNYEYSLDDIITDLCQ